MGISKKAGKTLTHTKEQTPFLQAQESQICEGDKYPTIVVVLTTISISSMCPTTACSVVKDTSTVTTTNSSLTPTVSRVSGGISSAFCRATSTLLSFLVLRSH
jgi:hypothetical protein